MVGRKKKREGHGGLLWLFRGVLPFRQVRPKGLKRCLDASQAVASLNFWLRVWSDSSLA